MRPSLTRAAVATLGCLLLPVLAAGCSDDSSDSASTSTSTSTTAAPEGNGNYPDEAALAAWLEQNGRSSDAPEMVIDALYSDYECDEANSSFVLVRALSEPIEGVDPELALHTQVAVDTYLCGPAYARSVIELTFQPGQANTDLNALIDELVEQQAG